LPSALYDSEALERYVCQVLRKRGCCNSFSDVARDLHAIATDLDSGERAVFGSNEHSDVPISQAVAASSALPLVYKPVRIGANEYVDGGLRGTASLDLAIEQGQTGDLHQPVGAAQKPQSGFDPIPRSRWWILERERRTVHRLSGDAHF
jgi:predicted acylesterase/phospholipase RssA